MPLSVGKPWEKFWLFLLVVLPAPAQSKRIGNLFSLVDVGDDDNCGIYDYCVPSGLGAVVAVSQGLEHTCAILADNRLETWLQPLLRNIFGNVTVSIDNLVAKLERNGAVACVTVERLDSRPHSATWEAQLSSDC
ncbi:VPS13B [Symbiodinium natans]|uniref:VPS13B protein n=1 Tax=Symbiodinium natans TaxID=878477 RepID=A0A812KGS3_9DINO|nr:VPS13B [Symbiodinium natans]